MVRLSPKALRFARQATTTELLLGRVAVPQAVSDQLNALEAEPQTVSRYIEIPEDLGKLFLSVLENNLVSAETPEQDSNDKAFMAAIVESLRRDLPKAL